MKSKISVIVPIYGVEKYLEQCVKTITEQTYQNLEILLVDDGSPDQSGEIADRLALTDDRIKVIHKVNGGLSDARNVGIEASTGDYLTFIDSDDYIHPQMMELLLQAVDDGKKDISICSYEMVYEGKEPEIKRFSLQDVKKVDGREIQQIYLHQDKKRLNYTVAWAKIYKKEIFAHIRYPKGRLHEDEYTTFRTLYEAKDIAYIDIPLYFYLSRETSIMGEFKAKRFDVFGGYETRMNYYMGHKEYSLAKDTFFLGIHMMAQYRMWMNPKNEDCSKALATSVLQWKALKRKYGSNWNYSFSEKLEMCMFQMGFGLYYTMWKLIRK